MRAPTLITAILVTLYVFYQVSFNLGQETLIRDMLTACRISAGENTSYDGRCDLSYVYDPNILKVHVDQVPVYCNANSGADCSY